MNSDPDKLRTLLDDVLPASGERCGPSGTEVLSILRNERQHRRRLQCGAALLALITLALVSFHWNNQPPAVTSVAQPPIKPAPIVIHRVNDEELFSLLQETPIALMELPNGDRRLLVIEQSSPESLSTSN